MQIAICDNNQVLLGQLEIMVEQSVQTIKPGLPVIIDNYSDDRALAQAVRGGKRYQIILLDWEMPGLGGENTGLIIRQYDQDCLIIVVTAHADYSLEAYKITTFRYVLKDRLHDDLVSALAAACQLLFRKSQTVLIRLANDQQICVPVAELVAVEHRNRQNIYYTVTGDYAGTYRESLQQIEQQLAPLGFVKPFRGYLVNPQHIRYQSMNQLTMQSGLVIPISRSYQEQMAKILLRAIEE